MIGGLLSALLDRMAYGAWCVGAALLFLGMCIIFVVALAFAAAALDNWWRGRTGRPW